MPHTLASGGSESTVLNFSASLDATSAAALATSALAAASAAALRASSAVSAAARASTSAPEQVSQAGGAGSPFCEHKRLVWGVGGTCAPKDCKRKQSHARATNSHYPPAITRLLVRVHASVCVCVCVCACVRARICVSMSAWANVRVHTCGDLGITQGCTRALNGSLCRLRSLLGALGIASRVGCRDAAHLQAHNRTGEEDC